MVSGVVQRVNDKQWNGKTFWSFALQGQDGWYNTGLKRPPAVGTFIEFNDKTNSKGFKEVDGPITIRTDGPVQTAAIPQSAGNANASKVTPSYGAGGSSAYWDRKEQRDIANDTARELGASRNTVLTIMDIMLRNEVIVLPATKAKREEAFFAIFDKYTKKLMGKEEIKEEETKDDGSVQESVSNSDENWS